MRCKFNALKPVYSGCWRFKFGNYQQTFDRDVNEREAILQQKFSSTGELFSWQMCPYSIFTQMNNSSSAMAISECLIFCPLSVNPQSAFACDHGICLP